MSIVEKWFNQLQWKEQADYISKSKSIAFAKLFSAYKYSYLCDTSPIWFYFPNRSPKPKLIKCAQYNACSWKYNENKKIKLINGY